jgi:dephospho-CoA kinase
MGVMRTFGLTGGIGMGKSTAGGILRRLGCEVVDTDVIARELTARGQPALDEIRDEFGQGCFTNGGELRRDVLAARIFADEPARRKLEAILHPRIREAWRQQLAVWASDHRKLAVVVIPLLFETDSAAELEHTICVGCSETVQRQRLSDRGWTTSELERRIEAQLPIRRKMELAEYVVWNDAGRDVLEEQLKRIVCAPATASRANAH